MIAKRNNIFFWVWLALMAISLTISSPVALADSAKSLYFQADACYKTIRNSPGKQKYRANWLGCIHKYEGVYKKDPSGVWAAAGLYMAGDLYRQLYRYSRRSSDNQEAIEHFRKVIAEFPNSAYREKSAKALARAIKDAPKTASSAGTARDERSRKLFIAAGTCYQELQTSPRLQKYRDRWLACIRKYEKVYENDNAGPWAAAGLYNAGQLYLGMYEKSFRRKDKEAAVEKFNRIVSGYLHSRYYQKAKDELAKMGIAPKKVTANRDAVKPKDHPDKDSRKSSSSQDAVAAIIQSAANDRKTTLQKDTPPATGPVMVSGLRFWSNPNYTRVVIDAENQAKYSYHLLREDPSLKKPMRLFIDLENSRLGNGINRVIPINDNLLSDARAGQFTSSTVRVVVDIKSIRTYKIFSLRNPFRIVIDLWGKETSGTQTAKAKSQQRESGKPGKDKIQAGSLAQQLALGVSRIVIDPGHGGKDPGASGYLKGVYEKKIALQIAKRLSRKIKERLKCEVILTRTGDRFLSLEERTAIANTKNADLFISIHANSTRDRRAYGLETYFLNLATDEEAIRVAATENATSTKNISDLQTILSDLMQNAKINESSRLAQRVQDAMYKTLKKKYSSIKNKGVKQAPFYVLLGAQMPAILIETSFISNSRECKRLIDPKYQERLCDGIVDGIARYIRETNPTALLKATPKKG